MHSGFSKGKAQPFHHSLMKREAQAGGLEMKCDNYTQHNYLCILIKFNNAVKVATMFCSRPGIILCTIRIPSSDQTGKGGGETCE